MTLQSRRILASALATGLVALAALVAFVRAGQTAALRVTVDADTLVLDTRSQLEHEGIVGTPCCASRGAIPTSLHLEWTAFLDMAGRTHGPDRVHAVAEHIGAELDTPIIVTCHAGHRAAVAARALRVAGYSDVRVSLGSWHEWAARAAAHGSDDA